MNIISAKNYSFFFNSDEESQSIIQSLFDTKNWLGWSNLESALAEKGKISKEQQLILMTTPYLEYVLPQYSQHSFHGVLDIADATELVEESFKQNISIAGWINIRDFRKLFWDKLHQETIVKFFKDSDQNIRATIYLVDSF